MVVRDFTLTRFQFRRDRVIGDSQVRVEHCHVGVLELHDADGRTGTGFFFSLFHPLPALRELERVFREEVWPGLDGEHPAALLNRVGRPRGGNIRGFSVPFEQAINQALWDLHGKALGLPLWRLLGGRDPKVRLYASGLDFHLSDEALRRVVRAGARREGYRGFKIKVGHPDLAWDLHRLRLVREAVGDAGPIMVDANEAWSPKEAIRRLTPVPARRHRHPLGRGPRACATISTACARSAWPSPRCMVNTGEYLGLRGKRKLIEARGVDILNVHGHISDVMRAGWLAAEHGLEVSLGNTQLRDRRPSGGGAARVPLDGILVPELRSPARAQPVERQRRLRPWRPTGRATASLCPIGARRELAVPDVLRPERAAGRAARADRSLPAAMTRRCRIRWEAEA